MGSEITISQSPTQPISHRSWKGAAIRNRWITGGHSSLNAVGAARTSRSEKCITTRWRFGLWCTYDSCGKRCLSLLQSRARAKGVHVEIYEKTAARRGHWAGRIWAAWRIR